MKRKYYIQKMDKDEEMNFEDMVKINTERTSK
jgi:hypothetical protein